MYVPTADRPFEVVAPTPVQVALPVSLPPVGITGGKLTPLNDWWRGTALKRTMETCRLFFDRLFGRGENRPVGLQGYTRSYGWQFGAVMGWNDEGEDYCLSLNGDSLEMIGQDRIPELWTHLYHLGFECSRLDLALDDHSREFLDLDRIGEAARVGNFEGFRRWQEKKPYRNVFTQELEGYEHSFGRRGRDGSGYYYRIYDKALESNGQVNAIRCELELCKVKKDNNPAHLYWEILLDTPPDQVWQKVAKIVLGKLAFIDRRPEAHGHVDRMLYLEWWQALLDAVKGGLVVAIRRIIPPFQRTMEYVRDTFAPILKLAGEIVADTGHDLMSMIRLWVDEAAYPRQQHGRRDMGLNVPRLLRLQQV